MKGCKFEFILLLSLLLVGCSENNEPISVSTPQYIIKGLESSIKPEGEIREIQIISDKVWTLDVHGIKWIEFDKTYGDKTPDGEPVVIKATFKPNRSGKDRNATISLCVGQVEKTNAIAKQKEIPQRVGDPNVTFNQALIDPFYSVRINEWISAGKHEGIPYADVQLDEVTKEFTPENTTDEIIDYFKSNQNKKIIVLLKNGVYRFKKHLRLYSNATLVGESHDVILLGETEDNNSDNYIINMYNAKNAGIRDITIKGGWVNYEPDPTLMEETLPGKGDHRMIDMNSAQDCFVDNVKIINSASHPIWISGNHNTIRDLYIDGAYCKGEGGQGYFFIDGDHNLITGCQITHLRHISFQNPSSKQNVFYKNEVRQEVTFHNNDGGDNLVEKNNIVVPVILKGWNAIMGPWSSQHKVGGKNFIYLNKCLEENRNNNTPWSDNRLYIGPLKVVVDDTQERYENFMPDPEFPEPVYKTFYPVMLE